MIVDKFGWPIERIVNRNNAWKNFLHSINYYIRCLIHGRGWISQKEWDQKITESGISDGISSISGLIHPKGKATESSNSDGIAASNWEW